LRKSFQTSNFVEHQSPNNFLYDDHRLNLYCEDLSWVVIIPLK
jgi:hypothetical protein